MRYIAAPVYAPVAPDPFLNLGMITMNKHSTVLISGVQEALKNPEPRHYNLEGGRLLAYDWEVTGQLLVSSYASGQERRPIGKQTQQALSMEIDAQDRMTGPARSFT